jgi:hypothetical protein
MNDGTYNGYANRATWCIAHWNGIQTREDVDYIKAALDGFIEDIENPFIQDLINFDDIDWGKLYEIADEAEKENNK